MSGVRCSVCVTGSVGDAQGAAVLGSESEANFGNGGGSQGEERAAEEVVNVMHIAALDEGVVF